MKSRVRNLLAAAAIVGSASACTQYANIETPGAPPPEVEAKMVLRDTRYRQTFDDMAALEKSLERFFESAEWSARYGDVQRHVWAVGPARAARP